MGSGEGFRLRNSVVCTVHRTCKEITWAEHVFKMEEGRSAFRILM